MQVNLLNGLTTINLVVYVIIAVMFARRSPKSRAHFWFLQLIIFGGMWIAIRFLENLRPYDFSWLVRIDFSLAAFISGILVMFAFHYPANNPKITAQKSFLIFLPLIILGALSFTNILIKPISTRLSEYYPGYYIYITILFFYFIIIGGGQLLLKYKRNTGIRRLQLGYMLVSYLITISILLFDSLHASINARFHERSIVVDTLFFNTSLIFASVTAFVMIRYRFMDIRLIIRRGTVKALSFFAVLAVYLLLLAIVAKPLFSNPQDVEPITYIVLGLIVLVTVEPLRKYVTAFVDKLFTEHDTRVEQAKKRLVFQLRSQQAYDGLQSEIQNVLKQVANVSKVDFIENDTAFSRGHPNTWAFAKITGKVLIPEEFQYRLDEDVQYAVMRDECLQDTASAIIPVGQGSTFIGCYILGPRKNKGAYTIEDVRALSELQMQFTGALLNTRLYKQAVERIRV